MRFLVLSAAVACLAFSTSASAQPPKEKPKELAALGPIVGDWTSEVTSKPAAWTPEEKKFQTSNHAEFVLDGWFLQHIEVNHVVGEPDKVTKAIWFSTFDPEAKEYVTWFFQSTGIMGRFTGRWNPTTKTFTFTPQEPPQNTTGFFEERFPNKDLIEGKLSYKGTDGQNMFDMVWTRTRQKELAPNPLREQWAKIGTPIEPIPKEVKTLEPFIGEWDSDFTQRPSVVSPNGGNRKGNMTAQWILDGRFLLGTSEVDNFKSLWISGYDTNKNAYRQVRFSNTGEMDESVGQWNDETQTFVWNVVNGRSGLSKSLTGRRIGSDAVHTHILAKDKDGKVHMDLTIKSTRKK